MHEVGADQPAEDDWAFDGVLGGLGDTQQQECDQGDGDLEAHGISVMPMKWRIFRVCLTDRKNSSIAQRRL